MPKFEVTLEQPGIFQGRIIVEAKTEEAAETAAIKYEGHIDWQLIDMCQEDIEVVSSMEIV